MQKEKVHHMHFISNAYRFIISLIFLIFMALTLVMNINFSRQNREYSLNYNMSAVKGLSDRILGQENYFMQLINSTYESYYAYKEGLFAHMNSEHPDSYAYRMEIYRFLSESFPPEPGLSALTVYAAGDDQIYSVTKQKQKVFSGDTQEFAPMIACFSDPHTRLMLIPSSSDEILGISRSYSFIYCLRDIFTRENIGAIQADYSVGEMETYLSGNYPGVKGDFLIIDSAGNVLLDTTGTWYGGRIPDPQLTASASFCNQLLKMNGVKYYANMEVLSYPDLRVIGLVPQKTLSADVRKNIALMLAATCTVTLLTCIGIYIYLNNSSRQLNLIYQTMLRIKNGDLTSYIPVVGKQKNELMDISISFNDMLKDLNLYIDKVYKTEIENQRYQLRVLQSQINPHFLYNTLEAIRMKAILDGVPEIGDMVYILSKIFRNSIKTGGILTVRQEMDNCKNYLRLCDIQYRDLFTYEFHIQEVLLPQPIIQHSLLVMIENYIMHGFDSGRTDNHLIIEGLRENGYAVFHVRDNGCGIPQEELARIRTSFLEGSMDTVEHIGLKNIYQRMRLLYGENCSLKIDSEYGKGTGITFSFQLEGEKEIDSSDLSR